ncbi:MAG: hypothetical protein II815_02325 [Bacteroidales bacterium]|nr:hypothetical protein [Bacteroidales bacterium]
MAKIAQKKTIKLEWKKTTFANMRTEDNTNFYMFERFGRIIYIGMTAVTSEQSVQDEINSKIADKLNGNKQGITVWLGYKKTNTNIKNPVLRLNDNIVREVENLLIYKVSPCENIQCKDNYNGRDLRIINTGCPLLPDEIDSTKLKTKANNLKNLRR